MVVEFWTSIVSQIVHCDQWWPQPGVGIIVKMIIVGIHDEWQQSSHQEIALFQITSMNLFCSILKSLVLIMENLLPN